MLVVVVALMVRKSDNDDGSRCCEVDDGEDILYLVELATTVRLVRMIP